LIKDRNIKDSLPQDVVTHVTAMCGARGEDWFDELPDAITELEQKWDITVGDPFPGIEYNFVATATGLDGSDLVLKIAPPFETVEIFAEAKFLETLNGEGAIHLIDVDRERQAILLERALPGKALHEEFAESPRDCIQPAIAVLRRILQKPPKDMSDTTTLDGWFANFERFRKTDFPKALGERALEIYRKLTRKSGDKLYIHGDFHPGNVVTATREKYLAIDPKGIVGQVGYDIAVFLINFERWQRENPDIETLLDEATNAFANAFDMTETEVREWVFADMVIGAWWNFEDMPELYEPEVAMPLIWHL
jgi:streptomycin 6-kinase